MSVQLDRFTIALLVHRPDAPVLDDDEAARLQDAHMAHLADLHEAGHLLAAGTFEVKVIPWMVPAGAMSFSPTHFHAL